MRNRIMKKFSPFFLIFQVTCWESFVKIMKYWGNYYIVKPIHVEDPKPEGAVPWLCPSSSMLIRPCIILSGEVMVLLPFLLFFLAVFVPQRSPLVTPPFHPLLSIFPYFIFLLYFSSPSDLLMLLLSSCHFWQVVFCGVMSLCVSPVWFRSAFPTTTTSPPPSLWHYQEDPGSSLETYFRHPNISGKLHRKQKAKQGHGHLNGNAERVVNWRNKLGSAAINLNSSLPWRTKMYLEATVWRCL